MRARIVDHSCLPPAFAAEWDALVAANAASGIMQTSGWARFKSAQGLAPLHIALSDDQDRLVGGSIFYTSKRNNGARILVAPEGPVLPWSNAADTAAGLRLIIDTAEQFARANGIISMRIEPRLTGSLPAVLREFGRAPVDLVPRETLFIDLSRTEEEILASMKPKGRYNIRLSERHGVTVRQTSQPNAVDHFYSVVREASERDGFALETKSFFTELAKALCPSGLAQFLSAEHEGEILGALLLTTCGTRGTYLYGGITNRKRNLMGGYALQWAAMKAAKAAGCTTYDFYGFDQFGSSVHAYARFSKFKRQFGGEVVRLIGAQDHFFLDCLADAFIRAVNESTLVTRG